MRLTFRGGIARLIRGTGWKSPKCDSVCLGRRREIRLSLGRAAEFMLDGARVSRAIYLGDDGALDATVTAWAERLVGSDPTDDGAFKRAALLATHGTAEQLDRFIATEKARLRLRALESLPPGDGRTIEMLGLRVGIFVYDKGRLDEEDILSANLIVYGGGPRPREADRQPLVRHPGQRDLPHRRRRGHRGQRRRRRRRVLRRPGQAHGDGEARHEAEGHDDRPGRLSRTWRGPSPSSVGASTRRTSPTSSRLCGS